ncbi:MAG: PAS domain-containing protein [Candidatus Thiodiazotropha sp. (ex Lucinoma kastoroae)]|nr:PAS domain-containing protein [Candidatus Thiodiazotropha sp. (ex Rostrolucina anterorostrata)]MCU7848003.1 PAS domain-containing protein [Candidatus Thiodiazotropha sp. (ex Lucinoma kastoroae)]
MNRAWRKYTMLREHRRCSGTRLFTTRDAFVSFSVFNVFEPGGVTTFVNLVAAEMLGYRAEQLACQPLHDLIHYAHEDSRPLNISKTQG